jgi:PAS domain S-box-containing protein
MSGTTSDEAGDPIRLAVLEAFVEVSADALISQDAAGRIVVWNRGAERIFGRHAEDVVGTPMRDLFPEHVRDDVTVLLDTAADGARVDHVETEAARRDGMRIPISVSLRPVRDAAGSCCGVVGVARDLTEQRLTQSDLGETEDGIRVSE